MTAITSHKDYKRIAHQAMRLKQFRRQAERTLDWYDIDDKLQLLEPIDARVRVFKSDLEQYAACQRLEPTLQVGALKTVAQTLVHTRLWLGWTQTELGLRTGLGGKTINKYERKGYLRANLESILLVADALEQGLFEKADSESRWHGKPKLLSDDYLKNGQSNSLTYDEDAEYLIEDGRLVEPPYEPVDDDNFGFGI